MIPLVLEESGGSERVFDIYSRLLRERIIFLGEQVTSDTANRIVYHSMLTHNKKRRFIHKNYIVLHVFFVIFLLNHVLHLHK